ncbi:hypothetical protein PTE30175_01411 [Pandoraea terrae]|uniref:Uncharacterized protein n=1 Tax=Pandoraea terrae TaxID=1537710 RepID=A0A5E4TNV7_9BURK|nr:hypothetical protein PTE30175_01411 [Pandoraea terrae]
MKMKRPVQSTKCTGRYFNEALSALSAFCAATYAVTSSSAG